MAFTRYTPSYSEKIGIDERWGWMDVFVRRWRVWGCWERGGWSLDVVQGPGVMSVHVEGDLYVCNIIRIFYDLLYVFVVMTCIALSPVPLLT